MQKQLQCIKDFDIKFNDYLQEVPNRDIPEDVKQLRISLMKEELKEVIDAMESEPIENIAKEFADLLFVLLGTVGTYGLFDIFEDVFDEVHQSNMSKTHVEGKGKPQKLEGYQAANIKKFFGK
jgi:predicted HAD superfamily Cof-like phosphohydrolase